MAIETAPEFQLKARRYNFCWLKPLGLRLKTMGFRRPRSVMMEAGVLGMGKKHRESHGKPEHFE